MGNNVTVKRKVSGRTNPMRLLLNCVLAIGLLVFTTISLAQSTTNRTTYYHNTLQGTPVAATDENGDIKWSQTYSTYGFHNGNSQEVEENSLVFGTAGHVEDQFDDRLLVYQQARYYDPALGRFLSIDPVGFHASNPQSFNRYAYVNNNPTTYVDPDGRLPFLIPVAIFLGKEIAAELASRATNGATDFLSVRRLGTAAAKRAGKGLKSLSKNKSDQNANVTNSGNRSFRDQMSPDEAARYDKSLSQRAPEQSSPYNRHNRYNEDGSLKQTTTYDQYGRRHRQYDVNDRRREEHQHNFEYSSDYPKGTRSDHLPIDE